MEVQKSSEFGTSLR